MITHLRTIIIFIKMINHIFIESIEDEVED